MLRTDTLEKSTLDLLKHLQKMPLFDRLRLVGGTALALQLGHRRSVDLDFFGNINASGLQIADELFENGYKDVEIRYDTKNIKIFNINQVKVDIVSYRYEWLESCIKTEGVSLAGLKDIAAMKLAAMTNRGTKKDFVDIYFLLQHFSLNQMLELYMQKYTDGTLFNVIRSITYFADAEENSMPEMIVQVQWEDIKTTIRHAVERYQ
ncbi:MAG: nucleotidyl transferase AbiEii/AbiGii toxin family protein [Prevotellaceae bacterium]|jgi:predicted nucleotidyltransferase component of viral defense system|nr:nucleotidyl transferase AbiEii/AbiGii toxin family protein [Prevotellaceae bacterium]